MDTSFFMSYIVMDLQGWVLLNRTSIGKKVYPLLILWENMASKSGTEKNIFLQISFAPGGFGDSTKESDSLPGEMNNDKYYLIEYTNIMFLFYVF